MSEQKWPERGCESADGKYYTDSHGNVHERIPCQGTCEDCSAGDLCVEFPYCTGFTQDMFRLVANAFVPDTPTKKFYEWKTTRFEQAMKGMIERCSGNRADPLYEGCEGCDDLVGKTCPARLFLEDAGHDDAWMFEIKISATDATRLSI